MALRTPLGDPIEIAALTQVFRASTPDVGFCHLGSLKANLGHLDAAAGVAGLIKTVLALQHREIPPLVNFRTPNPQLDLDRSPFVASAQASAWASDGAPRRAGVSSFGIGGTNAHVVLEEAPREHQELPCGKPICLWFRLRPLLRSSKPRRTLLTSRCAKRTIANDVEWTLQIGRQPFAHRRAVVARNLAEAVERLRHPQRAPIMTGLHEGEARPVAFLFSGQGSQHAGMGAGLYGTESAYREAIDRCAALFEPHSQIGYPQDHLCRPK